MSEVNSDLYPSYLESYGSLFSHLNSQFADLNTQEKSEEKGARFVDFSIKLIPHLEIGKRFNRPYASKKKTHDKGVDIVCDGPDSLVNLYAQSKYTIRGVQDLDSIISKFHSFDLERRGYSPNKPFNLSFFEEDDTDVPIAEFMIITMSDMKGIISKYERSQLTSRPFYDRLQALNRLHIVDGPSIFPILRGAYRKQLVLPTNVIIEFVKPYINHKEVYIGVISGSQIKSLYNGYGDALFLENIREFLGEISGRINPKSGQVTVNREIAKTLTDEPDKFLARNNGITFRSGTVTVVNDRTLKLDEASIVNGCQTTMSIVNNGNDECSVLIKIVQSTDSWDIAEAANFQNEIKQMDLRLARYIRPQEVRRYTSKSNIGFKSQSEETTAYALLDSFYQNDITYEELRALFIGLFSNTPNNSLDTNYTKLRHGIIEPLFENVTSREQMFEILFNIHNITQEAASSIQDSSVGTGDTDLFKRFWSENKPNYRAFLAILSSCGCVHKNIYLDNYVTDMNAMMDFLIEIQKVIEQKPELFIRYYRHAFMSVSIDVEKPDVNPDIIMRDMYRSIEGSDFRNLYSRLLRLARNDERLIQLEADMSQT